MGIQGLLPFLKQASRQVNLREYKGCTVAVDSYCWLHRGAFSCAGKLAMGEKTDAYVHYCMKFVNMMLANDIKPVMVFDGCNLPSKEGVEKGRRERRQQYRKKAAQFLREGKKKEAFECFQKCVDITSEMALSLMKACRAQGVDCIVAPYEADAQLAYLNKIGIADIVITEDSDLILFGCEKVVYKLDNMGNGVMIEKERLNEAAKLRKDNYSFDRFRYMCILSGCDYLQSLPGIGLGKACKLFKVSSNPDVTKTLKKIPTLLKVNVRVTDDYVEGFVRADNTFLHQLVYDPLLKKVVPLSPYPDGMQKEDFTYAGSYLPPDQAYQMALGNIDVKTKKKLDSFDPRTYKPPPQKAKNWNSTTNNQPLPPHRQCIWSKAYKPRRFNMDANANEVERSSTKGQEVMVSVAGLNKKNTAKRAREAVVCPDTKTDSELASMYEGAPAAKKPRLDENENQDPEPTMELTPFEDLLEQLNRESSEEEESEEPVKEEETPAKVWKPPRNIFAVSNKNKKERFNLDRPKEDVEVRSRFFSDKPLTNKKPKKTFLDCMDCGEVMNAADDDQKSLRDPLDSRLHKLVSPKQQKELDREADEPMETVEELRQVKEPVPKVTKKLVTQSFSWGKFKSKFARGANKQSNVSKSCVNKEFKPVTPKQSSLLTLRENVNRKLDKVDDDDVEESFEGTSELSQSDAHNPSSISAKKPSTSTITSHFSFCENESNEQTQSDNSMCEEQEVAQSSPGTSSLQRKRSKPDVRDLLKTTIVIDKEDSNDACDIQDTGANERTGQTPKENKRSKSDLRTMLKNSSKDNKNECEEVDYEDYLASSYSEEPDLSQRSVSMYSIDRDSITFSQSPLVADGVPAVARPEDDDEDSKDLVIVSVEKSLRSPEATPSTRPKMTPATSQGKNKFMTGCRSSGLSKSKGRSKTIKKNIENDRSQSNITNFFAQFRHNKNVEKLPSERVPLSPSKINIPTTMTPEMEKNGDIAKVQRRLVV